MREYGFSPTRIPPFKDRGYDSALLRKNMGVLDDNKSPWPGSMDETSGVINRSLIHRTLDSFPTLHIRLHIRILWFCCKIQ